MQHHLLHQLPELLPLLAVPPFTLGRKLSPANVWLGTRGTVTSLHSDPSDNLLCQVAGFKYFRLYALDQTPRLYATQMRRRHKTAFGTSPVRVEAPDEATYPDFLGAEYTEGILCPGDMLFIPKSHWHYLRSLTTSCSINFWFD
jgi:[protein]-arginine 3-hydroxylase / protease